jgi:hypothetical protein
MFEIFARCKDFRATRSFQFGCGYSHATAIFPNRRYQDAGTLGARVSVTSATSVCSRLLLTFVVLSVSVVPW